MQDWVLLTVGSVLRGDDAVGPYLGKLFEENPHAGLTVFNGDQMPEDYLAPLRRMAPDVLVVVDAADMGLPAGSVAILEESDVGSDYLLSTHSLPLSLMLEELHSSCKEIVFLGIQPAQTAFFAPLTAEVQKAAETIDKAIRTCEGQAATLKSAFSHLSDTSCKDGA